MVFIKGKNFRNKLERSTHNIFRKSTVYIDNKSDCKQTVQTQNKMTNIHKKHTYKAEHRQQSRESAIRDHALMCNTRSTSIKINEFETIMTNFPQSCREGFMNL